MILQTHNDNVLADLDAMNAVANPANGDTYFITSENTCYQYRDVTLDNSNGYWIKDETCKVYHEAETLEANHTDLTPIYPQVLQEPLITDLVDSGVLPKGFKSINYKSELKDGVYLHPVPNINSEGLITSVVYYMDYVDNTNTGTEVLRVEFVWDVDLTESIPAARTVIQRTSKTWIWKDKEGNDIAETKNKPSKKYDDIGKRRNEGQKRRENLLGMTQVGAVTMILYNGLAATQVDAELMLIALFEDLSAGMNTYMQSGKGTVYADVLAQAATHTWLDNAIGATAGSVLGLDVSWHTKTIKEYIIDKLKGLV